MGQTLKMTEPTIWALRKNARKSGQDNQPAPVTGGTLYEHLFGYDPIRVMTMPADAPENDIQKGSAENPKLNIINPQTNFAVMEIVADLPPEKV